MGTWVQTGQDDVTIDVTIDLSCASILEAWRSCLLLFLVCACLCFSVVLHLYLGYDRCEVLNKKPARTCHVCGVHKARGHRSDY